MLSSLAEAIKLYISGLTEESGLRGTNNDLI